jgi:hypothetical protein
MAMQMDISTYSQKVLEWIYGYAPVFRNYSTLNLDYVKRIVTSYMNVSRAQNNHMVQYTSQSWADPWFSAVARDAGISQTNADLQFVWVTLGGIIALGQTGNAAYVEYWKPYLSRDAEPAPRPPDQPDNPVAPPASSKKMIYILIGAAALVAFILFKKKK